MDRRRERQLADRVVVDADEPVQQVDDLVHAPRDTSEDAVPRVGSDRGNAVPEREPGVVDRFRRELDDVAHAGNADEHNSADLIPDAGNEFFDPVPRSPPVAMDKPHDDIDDTADRFHDGLDQRIDPVPDRTEVLPDPLSVGDNRLRDPRPVLLDPRDRLVDRGHDLRHHEIDELVQHRQDLLADLDLEVLEFERQDLELPGLRVSCRRRRAVHRRRGLQHDRVERQRVA
jgi:hypothetical protein